MPIQIVGTSPRMDDVAFWLNEPIFLPGFSWYHKVPHIEISVSEECQYLFYKIPGVEKLQVTEIKKFSSPKLISPRQKLFEVKLNKSSAVYQITGKEIHFRTGVHQIKDWLVIPEGYKVFIHAGTKLDMINGAGLVSMSPIECLGDFENPVLFTSSDSSSGGVSILQPKSPSIFLYTVFNNMKNLSMDSWELTGMVNMYEAEVTFDHCSFKNSHCEDALNIIRSNFKMADVDMQHTHGDAFDADFSYGQISRIRISNTGNDAIDVSGSRVIIKGALLTDIGDKAISAGEYSNVEIGNTSIKNAAVGVVSKDLSKVLVHDLTVRDSGKAFSAYRKKEEYGPATIEVEKYSVNNVRELKTALDGSEIKLPATPNE
jgi:hypothetical protein